MSKEGSETALVTTTILTTELTFPIQYVHEVFGIKFIQ